MKLKKHISSLIQGVLIATLAATAGLNAQENNRVDLEKITIYGKYFNTDNETGSRLGLTAMETPATVDVIEGDTIRERMDTSVMEAVTRSAGFSNDAHHAEGGLDMAARGFFGQQTVTKLYDGSNYYNAFNTITFPFDTWGIERIEVLKGPSSVLYGEGGIGGAFNVIPKRPQWEPSADLRMSTGEDDTRFIGVGLTGGLTDTLAYRLDYSNRQSDNWVDRGDSETEMVSASLLWKVSEDFTLTARYDWGDQEPMRYSGIPLVGDMEGDLVINGDFPRELLKRNYEVSDAEVRYKDSAARIKADWNISERLSMQSELYRLQNDRFWQNVDMFAYDRDAGTVKRDSPLIIAHDTEHNGFRTNVVFDAGDGGRKLKTSAGFEINDVTFKRPFYFGNEFDVVNAFNFNPGVFPNPVTTKKIISDVAQYAVFAEGQIGLTESLTLVLGLRHEDVETDFKETDGSTFDLNADELTGRAGLVFDLSDATVLYASYATGANHTNSGIVRISRNQRDVDFTETEQIEVGIKQSLLNNRLHWTLAWFDIVKNDVLAEDPDNPGPDNRIVIPEKTSDGVEFSLAYAPTETLQLTANGTLVNVERTVGGGCGWCADVEAPEETYNLGLAWAPLDKLRLLADARYVGKRFHPENPIPSYTVVDTSARWRFTEDLSIALRVDNVFDELYASAAYYWHAQWLVGKPRTYSLTLDYNFF